MDFIRGRILTYIDKVIDYFRPPHESICFTPDELLGLESAFNALRQEIPYEIPTIETVLETFYQVHELMGQDHDYDMAGMEAFEYLTRQGYRCLPGERARCEEQRDLMIERRREGE